MNLDSSSKGAILTRPCFLPIVWSISPQPGAICTIPVPSPAITISLPILSFPGSITLWWSAALIFLFFSSSFTIGKPPYSCCASKSSNGPSYSQPTISIPFIIPISSYPPLSLKIWAMVFNFGTPSIHCFFSLYCLSKRWNSRLSLAK